MKRPPKSLGRSQYLKIEEVGKLLDACAPHLYSIILCLVETGMRPGETKGLRWSEIREITLDDGTIAPMIFLPAERTKTRQARKIPVSDRLWTHLETQRAEQRPPKGTPLSERFASRYERT